MWNTNGLEEKEISIGEMATMICVDALKKANREKSLTEQYISVFDKFVKE